MLSFQPNINPAKFQGKSLLDMQIKTAGLRARFEGDSLSFGLNVKDLKKNNANKPDTKEKSASEENTLINDEPTSKDNPAAAEIDTFMKLIESNPEKCVELVYDVMYEPGNVDKKEALLSSESGCLKKAVKLGEMAVVKGLITLAGEVPYESRKKFVLSTNFKDIIEQDDPNKKHHDKTDLEPHTTVTEDFITLALSLKDRRVNKMLIADHDRRGSMTYPHLLLKNNQPGAVLKLSKLMKDEEIDEKTRKKLASIICDYMNASYIIKNQESKESIIGLLDFAGEILPDTVAKIKKMLPDGLIDDVTGTAEKPEMNIDLNTAKSLLGMFNQSCNISAGKHIGGQNNVFSGKR